MDELAALSQHIDELRTQLCGFEAVPEIAGSGWCEDEGLLGAMFGFHHQGASTSQGETKSYCSVLQSFVAAQQAQQAAQTGGTPELPSLPQPDLNALAAAVELMTHGDTVTWLPAYGCALLALPGVLNTAASSPGIGLVRGRLHLHLVCLDEWAFDIHSTSSGGMQHTAHCERSRVVYAGCVPQRQLQQVLVAHQAAMDEAMKQKAAKGTKGHQRTPAFALAALQRTLAVVVDQVPSPGAIHAEGGFTDVGQHTGSERRATDWPLVQQVLKALLEHGDLGAAEPTNEGSHRARSWDPSLLWQQALAHLEAWLLQRQAELVTVETAGPTMLTATAQMLASAAAKAAALADDGHDVGVLEAVCAHAHARLHTAAAQRAVAVAERLQLQPPDDGQWPGSVAWPQGVLPPPPQPTSQGAGLDAARERAAQALGSLPLLPAAGSSSVEALAALQHALWLRGDSSSGNDVTLQHRLRSIERLLFECAACGFEGHSWTMAEVDALQAIVDDYLLHMDCLLAAPAAAACMRVELVSRRTLVAWCAYCWMHKAAAQQHSLLLDYGVALDWTDLQNLVLSDRAAEDAARGVAQYLRQHSRTGRRMFSLRGGDATFDFALQFARSSEQVQAIWAAEQQAAAARKAAHWKVVSDKQARVNVLRLEIANLQTDISNLEGQLTRARSQRGMYDYGTSNYKSWDADVAILQSRLSAKKLLCGSKESELSRELQAPAPVVQPLPSDERRALQWLFFLHMGECAPHLQRLARMSFLAQQVLVEACGEEACKKLMVKALPMSLVEHYNKHQACKYFVPSPVRHGADGAVLARTTGKVPADGNIRPGDTVDSYYSADQGVWHPNDWQPMMQWQGQNCSKAPFNPFGPITPAQLVDAYTERLLGGKDVDALQDYMACTAFSAIPADRGNWGIARQDTKPSWLSKPGHLSFAALRAYPLVQLRALCVALRDRTLPLDQPAVQTLVRQAVYHLGELTNAEQPQRRWRVGWKEAGGVLAALQQEVGRLAEELRDTPREHEAVLLLGELAAHLSDYEPAFRTLARAFAAMTSAEADAVEAQAMQPATRPAAGEAPRSAGAAAAAAAEAATAARMRAKAVRARAMALLCHASGPLDPGGIDAGDVIELMVLVNHGHVFQDDPSLRQQLADLVVRAHGVMAARAPALVAAARRNPAILTGAVQRVLTRTPDGLQWTQLADAADRGSSRQLLASFEAVADGHLYSINLLDGTVLLDGAPPSRLPKDITQHPLFQRTFGVANFEVSRTETGILQTIRPVASISAGASGSGLDDSAGGATSPAAGAASWRYYDFFLHQEQDSVSALIIKEVDQAQNVELELLDPGQSSACGAWGAALPPRLRELHSHWLCRERGTLLLRPRHFQQRETQWLLQCEAQAENDVAADQAAAVRYDCRRVPPHLQGVPWTQVMRRHLAQLSERLVVLHGCPIVQVLSKFEYPQLIHIHESVSNTATAVLGGGSVPCGLRVELPRYGLEFEVASDGRLVSLNYAGYHLRKHQQLVLPAHAGAHAGAELMFTLPEFSTYLVLQRAAGAGPIVGTRRADLLVLVPAGSVGRGNRGTVTLYVPELSGIDMKLHCYEVHGRLSDLRTNNVAARLQLAALYAATSTLLAEPASRMTGAQMAVQLVRQSWVNRPLSPEELAHLRSIGALGGHLAPALPLLAHELEMSSRQLGHLWEAVWQLPSSLNASALNPKDGTRYMLHTAAIGGCWEANPRMLLTSGEELRLLGRLRPAKPEPACLRRGLMERLQLPRACPVAEGVMAGHEANLAGLVLPGKVSKGAPYPLEMDAGAAALLLQREMHSELQASWEAHHGMAPPAAVAPDCLERVLKMQAVVVFQREQVEEFLMDSLSAVPPGLGPSGASFRLHRLSDGVPTPARMDLMRLVMHPALLRQLNPFLSDVTHEVLGGAARLWLQLCVLEDRLGRLEGLTPAWQADRDIQPALVQELQTRRTWDAADHPEWLVFEAEGQLQIRPAQHIIAAHLMNNAGAISQLNMGEGKTRVILPMLALHWAKGKRLVRLNFLSRLLDEAHAHLHNHLCASVLGRKLVVLPFNRDVEVTEAAAQQMHACLQYALQEGGLLLVAPEWRLSLQLKAHELRAKGTAESAAAVGALQALAAVPCVDIVDESDEVLSHKYQLIYACGDREGLPARAERISATQALLRVVSRIKVDGRCVAGDTLNPHAAVLEPPGKPGAFSGLRLLPGEALDAVAGQLQLWLGGQILQDPPYELRWLRAYASDAGARERMLRCITDTSQTAEALLGQRLLTALAEDQLSHLLALRGLLAFSLLQHVLQKRHEVDYGVNRSPTARKRLAVPFRAAHCPSERSEFAQPDVALLFTCLSYYHDGLSEAEFLDALCTLLRMGDNAQVAHYDEWLQLSAPGIPAEDLQLLDSARKIDTTNPRQVQRLYKYFSHNMATVNFWLAYCVFPSETQQYPARLAATPWHLAANPHGAVGFSGTKDNHRLLPLQVTQSEPPDMALRGTDGKMLALLLRTPPLKALDESRAGTPVWGALLDYALDKGLDALLDCGALLAGTSNRQAARYVLQRMDSHRFKGVCYFDEGQRQWVICDPTGRCLPRNTAPIAERDAFVIYDDARCRGADLQLRRSAVGLLTFGPGICKDKVMQAAGRLRQLAQGTQTLRFAAPGDIASKIAAANGLSGGAAAPLSALHCLRWVMDNTVHATFSGVLEWAAQGVHFAATEDAPVEHVQRPELLELTQFYGDSRNLQPVAAVVARLSSAAESVASDWMSEGARALLTKVRERSARIGDGHEVMAGQRHVGGAADEECERELEKEEEEEQEVERQVPRVQPLAETDWRYADAVTATSAADIAAAVGVPLKRLAAAAASLAPHGLGGLGWSDRVWCTPNFLLAVAVGSEGQGATPSEYLRPLDVLLALPNGEAVLLSEREADGVLAAMRRAANRGGAAANRPTLLHLTYAKAASKEPLLAYAASSAAPSALPDAGALASMQLFNGDATYEAADVRAQLARLVRRRRQEAEALVDMRGRTAQLPRSHLELACDDAARGAG